MSLFQKKEGNFYLMVAMLGSVTNVHLQDMTISEPTRTPSILKMNVYLIILFLNKPPSCP